MLLLMLGLALLAAGCGSDAAQRQRKLEAARARAHAALVARQVVAGRGIFGQHCAACHTIEGHVAHPTFIESPIPNLDEVKPKQEYVVTRINTGGFDMASFERELSAEQVAAVAAYVANVSGSRITDTSSGEASALAQGQQVFAANCTRCHGIAGNPPTNRPTPPWPGTDFNNVRPSQRMVVQRATNGIREEMPAFRHRLTAAQIHAVAVYVTATAGR
jgi:cbb3-type cytochrome c oxidase subunit III